MRDATAAARPALVLGGGGTFGVIQAAYIHAALEHGFRPALVVGTSVGALNGAWIATHPDRPEELLRIWLGLDSLALVPRNLARMAAHLLSHPRSVSSNGVVPALLDRYLDGCTFEGTAIPLAVVATNLSTARKHVFRSGSLRPAILASTALPGVFEPVRIGADWFVDGGVCASVDIATAVTLGATEILAVDLTPRPAAGRPKTAIGVLRQSLGILSHAGTDAVEECVSRTLPMRLVRPDLSNASAWRLDDSPRSVAHNLRIAHADVARYIGTDGHVRPADPAAAAEDEAHGPALVNPERFFHRRQRGQAA